MKPKTLSLIQVNSAVFLWGLTLMFPKGIAMSPQGIVFFRALLSVMAIGIFFKATGGRLGVKRPKDYWVMGVLGLLMCVHWVTLFAALQLAEAAIVVVALNTYPALTTLAEPLAFGKRPRAMDVVLAVIVLVGVLIMLPEGSFDLIPVTLGGVVLKLPDISLRDPTTLAIALAVGSGALFGTRNIVIRKYANHYTGGALMFWQTLVTCVCLLAFVPTSAEVYTPRAIGLLVALGVGFTALPQSLYAHGLRHLSAKTVGILSLMQVLYAAFWGYLLFAETINLRTAIGGAIILTCIILETLRSTERKSSGTPDVPLAYGEA